MLPIYGHSGEQGLLVGPTREGSVFCLSTGPQGAHGSMTDAPKVEGGVGGREKVNSGHLQKMSEEAGGNAEASTNVGSGRDGRHGHGTKTDMCLTLRAPKRWKQEYMSKGGDNRQREGEVNRDASAEEGRTTNTPIAEH